MKKINFFNLHSPLYPLRWFIVSTALVLVFLSWHNLNGGRMFTRSGSPDWKSSGPGYHK
ncbi:MAG: hypothetical protein J0M10_17020 [Chitinophagales bacterium]|nr:hypothetical protein [Chitinophagales bacterium]